MAHPYKLTAFAVLVLILSLSSAGFAAKLTHLTGGHASIWTDYLMERAEQFKAVHDVEVEILSMSGREAREQYLAMRIGGLSPDVTDFWGALAGDYIAKGFFVDLKEYAAKEGYNLNELYQARTLEALTYEGELFSMPLYINPRVTYYNKDRFLAAGLADPNAQDGANWTWATMREAARSLTRDLNGDGTTDQFGIQSVTGSNWWQFVHQAGGKIYNRTLFPTESRFNTEPVFTATEFARSLLVDDQVVGGSLVEGTAAMSFNSSAQIRLTLEETGMNWDMSLHAMGPYSRASMFGIGGLQLSSESENKDLAWEWIKFITLDLDSVRTYVRTNLRIPPLRAVQAEYPQLASNLTPNWRVLLKAVDQPNSFTLPVVAKNTGAVNDAINGHLNQVWKSQLAVGVALEQIHSLVNALLK